MTQATATVMMPSGRIVRAQCVKPCQVGASAVFQWQGLAPFHATPLSDEDILAIEAVTHGI